MAENTDQATLEDITSYVETSDVLINYCTNQTLEGVERSFQCIDNFIKMRPVRDEDNLPLFLDSGDEAVNRLVLCAWMDHHKKNRPDQNYPDVIVPHFASAGGNNTNYFYMIYRMLIKLRVSTCSPRKSSISSKK
jgi:hypothetical protein